MGIISQLIGNYARSKAEETLSKAQDVNQQIQEKRTLMNLPGVDPFQRENFAQQIKDLIEKHGGPEGKKHGSKIGSMLSTLAGTMGEAVGRPRPQAPFQTATPNLPGRITMTEEQQAAQRQKAETERLGQLKQEAEQAETLKLGNLPKERAARRQEGESIGLTGDALKRYEATGQLPARYGEPEAPGLVAFRLPDGSVKRLLYDPSTHTTTNVAGKPVTLPEGTDFADPAAARAASAAEEGRQDALQAYAEKNNTTVDKLTGKQRVDAIREAKAGEGPQPVVANTPEFRVAQDLAYGKLTFGEFRGLYAYSRDAAKRLAIYDKARELNPNFDPAQFEMGFKFASSPKVRAQLASLDNVEAGVDDLLKFSAAAERAQVPVLNRFLTRGGLAIGSKTYSNFKTARTAFADELSGALGYGSATDMSREMGFDMTDPNMPPEIFSSNVRDVLIPFVQRKRNSMLNQMGPYAETERHLGGGGGGDLPKPSQPGQAPTDEVMRQYLDANGGDEKKALQALRNAGFK